MSLCAEIDLNGFIVESVGETFPACSEFALYSASYAERLTYWADLAIELDPAGSVFYPLLTAMFTATGVVLGLRLVYSILRTSTKEA